MHLTSVIFVIASCSPYCKKVSNISLGQLINQLSIEGLVLETDTIKYLLGLRMAYPLSEEKTV